MKKVVLPLLSLLYAAVAHAEPAASRLVFPISLTPENTQVSFEVDSTWHLVEGQIKHFSGEAWLTEQGNLNTVRARLEFHVASFDTDNGMRDKKMHAVMHAEKFPKARYELRALSGTCDVGQLAVGASCETELDSKVIIRDVEKQLKIPVKVSRLPDGLEVSGRTAFNWDEFGIEDPSIFIAKLAKRVSVLFNVHLPAEPK